MARALKLSVRCEPKCDPSPPPRCEEPQKEQKDSCKVETKSYCMPEKVKAPACDVENKKTAQSCHDADPCKAPAFKFALVDTDKPGKCLPEPKPCRDADIWDKCDSFKFSCERPEDTCRPEKVRCETEKPDRCEVEKTSKYIVVDRCDAPKIDRCEVEKNPCRDTSDCGPSKCAPPPCEVVYCPPTPCGDYLLAA